MPNRNWNKHYVVCPYYHAEDELLLVCDDWTGKFNAAMKFRNEADMQQHIDIYCKEHFRKCEVCRMIDGAYDFE